MKSILALLCASSVLALPLVSCSNDGKSALMRAANVAITGATLTGYITPAQAELVRERGALILNSEGSDAKIAAISEAIITGGVISGKITPQQAADLRAEGRVPLASALIPDSDPPAVIE